MPLGCLIIWVRLPPLPPPLIPLDNIGDNIPVIQKEEKEERAGKKGKHCRYAVPLLILYSL
jgi:hypothetical protein